MGARTATRRALTLGVVAALVLSGAASAQDESADGPPAPPFTRDTFAFAGAQTRAVPLTEALPDGGYAGVVTVRLRNRTRLEGPLSLRYFPYSGGPAVDLQTRDPRASVRVVEGSGGGRGVMRARDYAQLRLRFTLPAGRPLQDLDGFVVAQLRARGRFGPVARLRVQGAAPRVTFDPGSVVVDLERYEPSGADESTSVILRGPDAPLLARSPGPIARQILRDEDATVDVTVTPPRLEDGVYVSQVKVADATWLEAGAFEGEVPLTAGRGGPALRVEAKVRFTFLVLAVVVFLGALVGGLWRRYTNAGRDARVLRMRLRAVVAAYDREVAEHHGRIASHSLDGWLEPRTSGRGWSYPGTNGLAGMLWHLRTARTTRDVDTQRYRVRETIRNVERWQTIEPAARAATAVLEEESPRRGDHGLLSIKQCASYRELRRLLEDARVAPDPGRPPARDEAEWEARQLHDDAEVAALVSGLAGHSSVLELAREIWCYLCAYDHVRDRLPDAVLAEVQRCELVRAEAQYPDAATDPAALKRLRLDLQGRLDRLEELWPDDVPRPAREASVVDQQALEELELNPCAAVGTTAAKPSGNDWTTIVQADWAWTIISGLVATAAYAAGSTLIQSGTWGGDLADYATAFAAGFAGEVVPWRRLPIVRGLDGGVDEDPAPPAADPGTPTAGTSTRDAPAAGEREREPEPAREALV